MGNVMDSAPTTYSVNDTSKMQALGLTNTYKGAPQGATGVDSVDWGNKGSKLSFGVKILQDMGNNQLYVNTNSGVKVFLTSNGKALPNSAQLIKQGQNYGIGPAIMITGVPSAPVYSMFSVTDDDSSDGYKKITINSMADVKYAVTLDDDAYSTNEYTNKSLNAKHSGQYGEASIAGPFAPPPRDVWSGVADFNKAIGSIGEKLIIPIAADVIGKVIPGFGIISQITGLQDTLQKGLDKVWNAPRRQVSSGVSSFQTYMADRIKDPRLQRYFQKTQSQNSELIKKTGEKADPQVQQMQSWDNAGMLTKARALENNNDNMNVISTEKSLKSLISQLKTNLGNKVDPSTWWYIDQMQSGLDAASTANQKMNILTHFTNKILTDVIPILQKQQALSNPVKAPEKSSTVQRAPGQNTQSVTPKGPHGIPLESSVPPKGGSLGPLSYHPWVINGDYWHHPEQVTIQG